MNIGQLSKIVGTSEKTIRYYESIGIIPEPERSPNSYRTYTDKHAKRIRFVVGSRALGISLKDIRPLIDAYENGRAPCEHVYETLENKINECSELIQQLTELKHSLISIRNESIRLSGEIGEKCVCALIEEASMSSIS